MLATTLPEWLIERGIGETRAALIEDGEIVAARVRRDGVIAAGEVLEAKLTAVAPRVTVQGLSQGYGNERFFLPGGISGVSEGSVVRIEVLREAIGGREPWKLGLARMTDRPVEPAPPLAHGREADICGWDDLIDQARSGIVAFEGGELRIEATAAMTMIDVDGWLEPEKLAQQGAAAAGRAIGCLDIGGSIGIDLPTLRDKSARAKVDSILQSALPRPFERTAMNGFGFVQVVRPKVRPSLIDLAQERAAFEARLLLRRARSHVGAAVLTAHPAVVDLIERRPAWIGALERQIGGALTLRGDPALAMSGGNVH